MSDDSARLLAFRSIVTEDDCGPCGLIGKLRDECPYCNGSGKVYTSTREVTTTYVRRVNP